MTGDVKNGAGNTRETIGSRFGFIMLAAGCAIGLGNVWRFPYVAGAHGGALFVLLYLVFLLLLGFPVMLMELAVGRAAARGLYGAFRDLPKHRPSRWRFVALVMFSGNLLLMMMYTTVTGWMLSYFWDFLTGAATGQGGAVSPADRLAGLLADPGRMSIFMLAACGIGFAVCLGGLRAGVERITKLLMTGLFAMLIGLCIHALSLPGADAGIRFYLKPDFQKLGADLLGTVADSMAQAFFTLSLGVGSMTIFGSYIGRRNTLATESLLIIGCDTLVALLAGMVIFSACFSYGIDAGGGPGLVLISLTGIFEHMSGGRFWGAMFFMFMSTAALTTVIAVFENLVAFMMDEWHWNRRVASVVNFLIVGLLSFPCLLGYNMLKDVHPLGGSSTILDFEDWLLSDLLMPFGALMFAVFCCWNVGWNWRGFLTEVNTGKGVRLSGKLRWYVTILVPALVLALFVIGLYNRFFK